MRIGLSTVLLFGLALPSAAMADIVPVASSAIQGENVLFNNGVQSGTLVTGTTQLGSLIDFTGSSVGGSTVLRANGGQARVEGGLNGATNSPNDTLMLQSLSFGLRDGGTFSNVELNLFNGGGEAGLVTFNLTDNEGQLFTFSNLAIGVGSNMFGFQGIMGQSIANLAFSTTGGIADVRQLRIDEVAVSAVPEASAWAMMIFGFGAVGFQVRRRRQRPQSVCA